MTVIQLTGEEDGARFDAVNGNSRIDSPSPEPCTLLLTTGALLALDFLRKRTRATYWIGSGRR